MTLRNDIYNKNVIILVSNEAILSATCLGQGLTALRKARIGHEQYYYQAFILLTTGIERLLKLSIITFYRNKEGYSSSNEELKKYGHNIQDLFKNVEKKINPEKNFLAEDILYQDVMTFLTEFANGSRYYNLDTLNGKEKIKDPLNEWSKIQDKISHRHIKLLKENFFSKLMQDGNTFHDMDDFIVQSNKIDSFWAQLVYKNELEVMQGYSVYYIFRIICYLVDQLHQLSHKKNLMPYLSEFYRLFSYNEMTEKQIITKKNWNYIP